VLSFIKVVLDGANKTTEAEAEHAKHYGKPAPVTRADRKWSHKEKFDFVSFIIGSLVSLSALVFAGFKAGGEAGSVVMWGLAFVLAIFAMAWAARSYAKPKAEATGAHPIANQAGTVAAEVVTTESDKTEGSSLRTS
jgi:hypothetical protein